MKDLFAEFKKATLKQHLTIGVTAFAFALGVNYLLFTTDAGVKIQASAIEATGVAKVPAGPDFEISTTAGSDRLVVKLAKAVTGVKSLEFTLLADPIIVTLDTAQMAGGADGETSALVGEVIRMVSVSGVAQYKVIFATPTDIVAGTSVAIIAFSWKGIGTTPVNVAGVRAFTTTGDFELSSIWTEVTRKEVK